MKIPAIPRGRRLLTAVVSASLLLLGALPAGARPDHIDHIDQIDRYVAENDHPMGSQIAKHEGGEPMVLVPQDVGAQAVVYGIDVSGWQGNVDWAYWWGQGKRFAYVKATENTNYRNPYFAQQYNGSYNIGMIRGAYHFATPNTSSGTAQADYFINNGGGWSRDGKTLPGALDMEYNPYGATCYGLSKAGMTAWIKAFSDRYHARTGRWPVIYTSTSWWSQCVDGDFSSTNPLWVARYASSPGTLPYAWGFYTIWQYSSSPIDQNQFNGAYDRLQALANG
ncbi:lysozyme [Kibdelosporangium persicum]|uniref:Lysozyme n=1 Tax=Kibdelosporangium persicum TaxID=2698649 RepID=A0ABX2EYA9_9PSEU|nr:lysozyme [Kibdelosporangium persicum]NRN63751.1 Lysozyme [Kibdelosporangium persicum]